jgi:hypothetical protein
VTRGRGVLSDRRAIGHHPTVSEQLLRSPNGVEYVVTVEPAKHISAFVASPSRWWATLTRDRSTWITVVRGNIPVLRERWSNTQAAGRRAEAVLTQIRSGHEMSGVAWRRRPR